MAALTAFREPQIVMNIFDEDNFNDFNARKNRYGIWWSFYENTAYRHVHTWAIRYKTEHGLYKYIRNIYNPTYRLVEFWVTHLMGGYLDQDAGDGTITDSCLPIITQNELLHPAIAQVWQWSNWQQKKDLYSKYGVCMGDVGLKVIDDTSRGKVYLQVVHPKIIKDLVKDNFGNVKGYELEEERTDPRDPSGTQKCTYIETATRVENSDEVLFATYLNGTPYPWNGEAAEWAEDYGFVPFVHVLNIDNGFDYGFAEMHCGRSKIHETDDLTSKLDDQIRKTVDVPWFFSGMKKPASTPRTTTEASSTDRPEPGREEIPALYSSDAGARAQPLVANLDIAATTEHINNLLREVERDYPELQMDVYASGDTSGKALRTARQRTTAKVEQRRIAYDHGLVSAQMMAVAIGGMRGYGEEFSGFDLDSYARGDLDHSIGKRAVFEKDIVDDLEQNKLFWETAAVAIEKTGISLEAYLEVQGWTEEQIARITRQNRRAGALALRQQLRATPEQTPTQQEQAESTNTSEVEIETETATIEGTNETEVT